MKEVYNNNKVVEKSMNEIQKALYRMLKSTLLFNKKLGDDLEKNGFQVNLYDPCVANKQVNGHQMTIVWHVDDLNVSHKDPWEATTMAIFLSKIYGDLKVQCGKQFKYLGMDVDYSTPGEVKISMIPCIGNILKDVPEEITGTAATPAADFLFEVRANTKLTKLPKEQEMAFHDNVAKLCFICICARHDIQIPVAFLTTKVKEPDDDN